MLIIDTSVLIDFFKGKYSPQTQYMHRVESQGVSFAIPAVCAQELLQGARDNREYKKLREYLITQELLVPKDPVTTHFEAAKIYFDCKRLGISPRSSIDCLIVQLVIEFDGELLHSDKDFERIARARKFNCIENYK
jgi:predicted nucleic acid-binding protein